MKCESVDKDFAEFEYCRLKSQNRTFKYISLKVNLFKVPISRIKVNIALFQRLNGYKPFLYNITVDVCNYYKNPKSKPVYTFFYNLFKNASNMNHSCPYNHDLVVEKLTAEYINQQMTTVLPFPNGNYMFKMHWIAYDVLRAVFRIHYSLS
nr:uncharacterized protein LOC108016425 [Drosophila suzukii]